MLSSDDSLGLFTSFSSRAVVPVILRATPFYFVRKIFCKLRLMDLVRRGFSSCSRS